MGVYDLVYVPCPNCGTVKSFQSKGAPRPAMHDYTLDNAPSDVLANVNRHSPHQCDVCETWFAVEKRKWWQLWRRRWRPVRARARRPDELPEIDGWYRR